MRWILLFDKDDRVTVYFHLWFYKLFLFFFRKIIRVQPYNKRDSIKDLSDFFYNNL